MDEEDRSTAPQFPRDDYFIISPLVALHNGVTEPWLISNSLISSSSYGDVMKTRGGGGGGWSILEGVLVTSPPLFTPTFKNFETVKHRLLDLGLKRMQGSALETINLCLRWLSSGIC